MKKIMGSYAKESNKPQVIATSNAFKIVLPNVNARKETRIAVAESVEGPVEKPVVQPVAYDLDSNEGKIMANLTTNESITRQKAQDLLEVGQAQAGRTLKAMSEDGLVKRHGGSRSTHYEKV